MCVASTSIIPDVCCLSSRPDERGEPPLSVLVRNNPVLPSTTRCSSATEVANECRRALEGARDLIRSVRLPFFNQRNWRTVGPLRS